MTSVPARGETWRCRFISSPRFLRSIVGSLEEERIEVRSVNLRVAQGTGLILLGLVMERRRARNRRLDGERMALEAHRIYLAAR